MHLSPVSVILIAAFMCIAAIVLWVVVAERLDPPEPGRHQVRKRDPFADDADRDDPHGERYGDFIRDTAAHAWRYDPGPDLDALPVGTGQFPALPDDDPPEVTGVQPAATRYLGKDIDEYLGELFGKPAEVSGD